MAKITQTLRGAILHAEIAAWLEKNLDTFYAGIPPVPTPEEFVKLFEATPEYAATTRRNHLYCTTNVTIHLPEKSTSTYSALRQEMQLPVALPIIKQKMLVLDNEWEVSYDDDRHNITARESSVRQQRRAEFTRKSRHHREVSSHALRLMKTTKQLADIYPHLAAHECVQNIIAREKDLREQAKLRKKNAKPLEVIEITDSNTAIAKARLLGAKYVS